MSPYSISTLSSGPLMPLLCREGVEGEVLDSVEKSLCIVLTCAGTLCCILVLISGCFLGFSACCTAALLFFLLCCAWEHSDNSHGDVPGLVDGQGICSVSGLLTGQVGTPM